MNTLLLQQGATSLPLWGLLQCRLCGARARSILLQDQQSISYPQVPLQRGEESLMEFNSRESLVSRSPDGGGRGTWRAAENRAQPTTLGSREIAPFLSFQDCSILDAGKIHVHLLSWLAYLKGFCDWIWPECVLDVCGKWRQKGAQMEERQKNDEINKQIHSY